MRTINIIVQKTTVILMTIVLLAMQDGLVRYRHAHLLDNGMIVWHAHPFGDGQSTHGGKTHHHSPGNQFALDQMAQSLPFTNIATTLSKLHSARLNRYRSQRVQGHSIHPFITIQLRAPPLVA
ncbi:MAG: hypothetical protein CVU06_11930 [Bacteroidetes bacterium HGW-Bacteroidetes-22]|nr:MAG: hypothetical protein CVU06_11930 [Bacteroidetes bacterium HGW-Bacteroidetes-22]